MTYDAHRICLIEWCEKAVFRQDLCASHFHRKRRHGDPLLGRTYNGEPMVFLLKAIESNTDKCIIWPFGFDGTGYAQIWHDGRHRPASRVCLELAKGPPPTSKHQAAHAPIICHNRACVNDAHLRWATRSENEADKILDKTDKKSLRGEVS